MIIMKDVRQSSNSNNDYQDRKRNSLRDNNNNNNGKRSYNSDQSYRNNQRRESPTSKRRRTNNNDSTIEDEYHEYRKNFIIQLINFSFINLLVQVLKKKLSKYLQQKQNHNMYVHVHRNYIIDVMHK